MTSGSDSGTIRIWNVESGQCIKLLEGHKKSVIGIEKLTDEQIIISPNDGTIKLWNVDSGERLRTFTDIQYLVNFVEI